MNISVIGAGHVGLIAATCFSEVGHTVVCVDNDEAKLRALREGSAPFFEPYVQDLLQRNLAAGRLSFSSSIASTRGAEAVFICVGTPPLANGDADLSAIEGVSRSLAAVADTRLLIVEKSTVPVLTGQRISRAVRTVRRDLDLSVASNPEFLSEGRAVLDFLFPDRIVVGVEDGRTAKLLREIYRPIVERTFDWKPAGVELPEGRRPYLQVDRNTAEMIKYASNSFLSTKISYINMMSQLCAAVGADVTKVAEGMGLDHRIGREFLRAGIGYGGFCFPKDVRSLIKFGEACGCNLGLLQEVEKINAEQVAQFVETVRHELWIVKAKKVAVWGLAFKGGTDDTRFSPAIAVIERMQAEGACITAYDPQAMQEASSLLPDIRYASTALEAVREADCLLVLTDWQDFANVDLEAVRREMAHPLIVDGRNLFDPATMAAQGFEYHSIGRPAVEPVEAARAEWANVQPESTPYAHPDQTGHVNGGAL